MIPPRHLPQSQDVIVRALKRFYNLGVYPEWWKLEALTPDQWRQVDALLRARDPHCRGVLVLGLNAPVEELKLGLADARSAQTCRGFAVGRTLWADPARAWLAGSIDDATLVARVAANFADLIAAWPKARETEALPPRPRSPENSSRSTWTRPFV